jgi:hypothetical protein
MTREKVYKVTVELEIYGQSSKDAVLDWLDEALSVDGLFVEKMSKPSLVKEENGESK